jgi:Na+-translocating ferredoxin:NAD+ oxidoreductase RNF subunit RnfB
LLSLQLKGSMNHQILNAVLFMLSLGGVLALCIAFANRKLYVYEDPRIDSTEQKLPGTNCGACGKPGCRAFAEALVQGTANPSECTVSDEAAKAEIAESLGVALSASEKRVARLACGGGNHVARQRTRYVGMQSCRAADLVAGGGKGCWYGCLGLEDCGVACTFDAIHFNEQGLPVVDPEKCTACGDCVDACPKGLFSIQPISHQLWINCKSLEFGEKAEAECDVACTACGKCVADAGGELITIKNNLAVIDYSLNHFSSMDLIQRCPTGAILWITPDQIPQSGRAAKPVIRKSALPVG